MIGSEVREELLEYKSLERSEVTRRCFKVYPGKQNGKRLFLDEHCRAMPTTMLRLAIENFPGALRMYYPKGRT